MYTRLHADENGIIGKGVKFERIRRVTGYLVGTLDRFNDAKRAEVHDRVKHMHLQEEQPLFVRGYQNRTLNTKPYSYE